MGIRIAPRSLKEQLQVNKKIFSQRNPALTGRHFTAEFRTPKGNTFTLSDVSSRLMVKGDEGEWLAKLDKYAAKIDATHLAALIPEMVEIPPVQVASLSQPIDISIRKISNVDFCAYLEATGQKLSEELLIDLHPVVLVRWEDVERDKTDDARMTYCKWLESLTGHKYGLASETLWEFVARHAKQFGIHDMPGHIIEWVKDEYQRGSGLHVVRGGHLGLTGRAGYPSDYRNIELGFRVVRYR